jgi:hypothetical protein
MSDRFYRQQMAYLNIKSVEELGKAHRGEIVKRDKREASRKKGSATVTASDTPKKRVKADVLQSVNDFLHEPVDLLKALTAAELENLEKALQFMLENQGSVSCTYTKLLTRTKAPLLEQINTLLGSHIKLDLSKMTMVGLDLLAQQLCKGLKTK